MLTYKTMTGAVLAGLCLAAGGVGSAAAQPTKTTYPVSFPASTVVACGAYEVVLAGLAGEFTDTVFTDKEGDIVRLIRHASLTGVLRSQTGDELPYRVKRTAMTEFGTLTTTVTGLSRQVRLPGGGVVALAAGREVVDFSQGFPPATIETAGRSIADFEAHSATSCDGLDPDPPLRLDHGSLLNTQMPSYLSGAAAAGPAAHPRWTNWSGRRARSTAGHAPSPGRESRRALPSP